MFVKINKTIYDEKQYIKEVIWLKNDTKRRLVDLLNKDYILINNFENSFNHIKLQLYNKKLGINIYFEFNARKPFIM
jgi:hypothetical protein